MRMARAMNLIITINRRKFFRHHPRSALMLLALLIFSYLYWMTMDFRNSLQTPAVILEVKGGIGNQLFQFACHYALAKQLKWPLYIVPKDPLFIKTVPFSALSPNHRSFEPDYRDFALDQFQIPQLNILNGSVRILNSIKYLSDELLLKLIEGQQKPNPREMVSLGEDYYCQSVELWSKYKDDIRAMFQVREESLKNETLVEFIDQIKTLGQRSVALHIRRGDFVSSNRYHIPISYQRRAIRKMVNLLKKRGIKDKPVFFVFSDDMEHAKKKLNALQVQDGFQFVFVSGKEKNSITEFYLMTLCSHIIISNSTFGWWAAYLIKNENKIVIASTSPPVAPSEDEDGFTHAMNGIMFLPKDWIVMNPFNGGL